MNEVRKEIQKMEEERKILKTGRTKYKTSKPVLMSRERKVTAKGRVISVYRHFQCALALVLISLKKM